MDGGRQRGGGGLLRLVNGIGRGGGVGRARRGGGEEIGRRRGSALLRGLLDARSSTCRHSPLPFHGGGKGEEEQEREGVRGKEGKGEEKVEGEGEGGRMTIARKPWPRTGLVWLCRSSGVGTISNALAHRQHRPSRSWTRRGTRRRRWAGTREEAMGWRFLVPWAVRGVWVFGKKVQRRTGRTGYGSREPRVEEPKVQQPWGYHS